jgi:oxygen-dependent protoporphyrinogen oxidase
MPKIVIIGAGISGLSLAYRLEQALPDAEVLVLEQRSRLGGTIGTERRDGFQVEIGPNGVLDTKPSTLSLTREVGLGDQLIMASEAAGKNRYLFLDGKLHLLPHSFLSFLGSDLLSWHGKFGMIAERWRRRRADPGDESIDAFARRRAGPEVADVFADGLVTGIYAGDSRLLSVRACFPRLAAFEEQHGSVLKGFGRAAKQRRADARTRGEPPPKPGKLWSLTAGLGSLIDALAQRLRTRPIAGINVRRIARTEEKSWIVHGEGRDTWNADAVVLACPAYQQGAILHELDSELADRIGAIPYNRVAVIALGYRRADLACNLDAFGYIAPQRTRRDVLGVQYCSSTYAGRAPEGTVLLRAMSGGWHRAEVAGWDDARLLAAVRAELALVLGIRAEPIFHHIVRWDRAIPQYHVGHLERVTWIEGRASAYPGLFLAGNAYKGVALNDCTEQAELLAAHVKNFLAAPVTA